MTKTKKRKTPTVSEPPEIQYSWDYDEFVFSEKNREVDHDEQDDEISRGMQELMNSIQDRPDLLPYDPGLIGKDKEIIDGQRTLTALKLIEQNRGEPIAPFYYIEKDDETAASASIFNATRKNWRTKDYIDTYAARGYEDYQKLQEFLQSYPFPPNTGMALWYRGQHKPGGEAMKRFKAGRMDSAHKKFATEVGEELLQLRDDCDVEFAFLQSFVIAYVKIKKAYKQDETGHIEKFKFSVFKRKLQKQKGQPLVRRSNFQEYMYDIRNVYSWHRQSIADIY